MRVVRRFGQGSLIEQHIRLTAGSARLDFETRVEWYEDHRFLKVAFPVNVLSPRATYEIQFGHTERPTHYNTSWDLARFEVCAQKWADLSEPGYGVALLNYGKYGHDIHGNVMRLSPLRAPTCPDPFADRGEHRFTYACCRTRATSGLAAWPSKLTRSTYRYGSPRRKARGQRASAKLCRRGWNISPWTGRAW